MDGDGDSPGAALDRRGRRVGGADGECRAGVETAVPCGVEDLICEQEILVQARGGHSLDLADGGAGERVVPGRGLARGQGGRFVGLDVRPELLSRQRRRHRPEVVVERVGFEDKSGGDQPVDAHHVSLSVSAAC